MDLPKLLLHCCCAPCATHVAETLRPLFRVACYFYNPNIHPEEEHRLRREEVRRLAAHYDVPLVSPDYDPSAWSVAVRGHESQPEGGSRCWICYRLRLEETARFAAENGYLWFASTLTLSPHKSAKAINPIGEEVAAARGVRFYAADFKKREGFKLSLKITRELGLYRQSYCGCHLSRRPPAEETEKTEGGAAGRSDNPEANALDRL